MTGGRAGRCEAEVIFPNERAYESGASHLPSPSELEAEYIFVPATLLNAYNRPEHRFRNRKNDSVNQRTCHQSQGVACEHLCSCYQHRSDYCHDMLMILLAVNARSAAVATIASSRPATTPAEMPGLSGFS